MYILFIQVSGQRLFVKNQRELVHKYACVLLLVCCAVLQLVCCAVLLLLVCCVLCVLLQQAHVG